MTQRIIVSILLWLGMTVIGLVLYLLGFILVPIAAACGAYRVVPDKNNTIFTNPKYTWHFTWRFMWLWDNYEDGIANDTYWKAPNMFLRIVYWSCIRNPSNNLRLVPILNVKIKPGRVNFIGSMTNRLKTYNDNPLQNMKSVWDKNTQKYDTNIAQWFFCWCGTYSNFYINFNIGHTLWRFWIGWKIYPTDVYGVTEYRKKGAGFSTQLKRLL